MKAGLWLVDIDYCTLYLFNSLLLKLAELITLITALCNLYVTYVTCIMALQLHTDIDRGEGRAKYILTGEGAGSVFVIDDKTGNIHVTKSLDREEKEEYILLAQAVDKVTLRPLEPPSQFIIKVQDINDNPPVFLHPPYRASVPEMSNVGEGGTWGLYVETCIEQWEY